jgi:hypothetical protein
LKKGSPIYKAAIIDKVITILKNPKFIIYKFVFERSRETSLGMNWEMPKLAQWLVVLKKARAIE